MAGMRAPLLAATALLLAACAGNGEPPAAEEKQQAEEVASLPTPPEERSPASPSPEPAPPAGDVAPEQRLPPGEDPPPAPRLPSDAVDRAVLEFGWYLDTKPDSLGLRNQIAELALRKDPRVAAALKPLLRHEDDDVKIAVARCIGEQGDPSVAALLENLADGKGMEGKPLLHAALLEGIGEADGKGHYKYLLKAAKKHLDTDPLVAAAAYRAAAQNVSRETVDDLVQELQRAFYVSANDGPVKMASRHECRAVLIGLLEGLTGEPLGGDVRIWTEWWRENGKTWKPPLPAAEESAALNATDTFESPGYGFSIRKPGPGWVFRRPGTRGPLLVVEALHEGRWAAWVEITAASTKNYKSKTPEAWAAEMRAGFEKKFRTIDEAEWERTPRVAGEPAVEQVVRGMHRDHDAVVMRNVYVCRSGVMVQCISFRKEGTPPALEEDIEAILGSLRFTR